MPSTPAIAESGSLGRLTTPLGSVAVNGRLRRLVLAITSFPAMLVCLLLTIEFIMMRGAVADPDIWWHLRNAEHLLTTHQFPDHDVYSFTVAGQPWMNHEWMAELPFYWGWSRWGLAGLQAVEFGVIAAIFLGLLYLCYAESGNFKAAMAACCVATFLATVSFGPRTILLGYLCMVALLIVLQRFRRIGSGGLWLLPPLFCVWVNTHGSWLLGMVVLAIAGAAGMVTGRWGRVQAEPWTARQARQLIVAGVASAAALFVNPFGWRLVAYPFDLAFQQKLNISHVAEWVSLNFHEPRGKMVLILLAVLLLSALVREFRWTLAELGMVGFALYSGLTHVRFLFLLGIMLAPVLARMLDFFPPYRPEAETRLLNVAVMVAMIVGVASYWPGTAELQQSVDEQYPTQAVAYLQAHPVEGPMLSHYLWGGYLGWKNPVLKSFVDSRVDIFERAGVLQDYIDMLALKNPQMLLDKYQIQCVLFPHDEPLTYALEHDPGWKTVYSDPVSVLLERTGAATKVRQ